MESSSAHVLHASVYVLPHILGIVAAGPYLLWTFCCRKKSLEQFRLHLPGHNLRWILCFIVILLYMTAFMEGILNMFDHFSREYVPEISEGHIFYPMASIVAVVCMLLLLLGYSVIENYKCGYVLPMTVVYWIFVIVSAGSRILMIGETFGTDSLSYMLACLTLPVAVVQLIVDLYDMVQMVRCS